MDARTERRSEGPGKAFERQVAVLAFVVAMLAFLVHRTAAGALGPGDAVHVLEHELVQDPSLGSTRALVAQGFAATLDPDGGPDERGAARPLALLSLQLDTALGAGPRQLSGYRRTSVALHALNAGLLVVLCAFLLNNVWGAGAAGLVFALHPLAVEPVLWLGERGTLLGAFLALCSSVAYVRWARLGGALRYVLASSAFVLALCAHPGCAFLPLFLLAFDAWPLRRFGVRAVLEQLPWLALGAAALALAAARHGGGGLADLARDLGRHASKLVRPVELSVVVPNGAGGSVGLDSLAYLPLLALAILLAAALGAVARPGPAVVLRRAFVAAVALGLALPLAAGTRARQAEWATSVGLFERAARVAPEAAAAHAGLAAALVREGRADEAVRAYQDALRLDPFHPGAWGELGDLYLERGDHAAALDAYENAFGLFPEDARCATSLALAVARAGDGERALELLRRATELDPDDARTRHELGLRLLLAGHAPEAEEHLAAAVRLRPRWTQARASYARCLIGDERWAEAKDQLVAGLALDAGDHELHNNLAVVLTELGDEAGALEHSAVTTRLRADQADVHHNHGNALARAGQRDAALVAYDRALAIEPDLLPTIVNRALLLKEMGRRDDALQGLERAVELAPDNQELAGVLLRVRSGE